MADLSNDCPGYHLHPRDGLWSGHRRVVDFDPRPGLSLSLKGRYGFPNTFGSKIVQREKANYTLQLQNDALLGKNDRKNYRCGSSGFDSIEGRPMTILRKID
jgi:hypothetical protein